ncbi:hypothetical protein HDU93_000998 [Gonapodya sp. JEL0774]|nr:hypothetical protein HDU93_000998 [Gonapodya sp. JEL0774]
MALIEKGVHHSAHLVEFSRGDLKADWYGELFPRRQVPLLVDEGKPLGESGAINSYLEAKFPEPSLEPVGDAYVKAVGRMRTFEADGKLPSVLRDVMAACREDDPAKKTELLTGATLKMKSELSLWESYLAKSGANWLCGTSITFADLALYHHIAQLVERHGLSLASAGFPLLGGWYSRMSERKSAKETAPPHWLSGPVPEKFVVLKDLTA